MRDVYEGIVGHIRVTCGGRDVLSKSNVIAYTAADIMAAVAGGNNDFLPQHIGFMYGADQTPDLDDPDGLPAATKRVQTWADIAAQCADITANVAICPLALTPSTTLIGSASRYTGNGVVFAAHTGAPLEYAFATSSPFAAAMTSLSPVYIYHAILLNRRTVGGNIVYTPFARSRVGTTPFTAKPTDQDIGIFWTIEFK